MVDESNNGFTTLLHPEGRTGHYPVISNMACFLARIDLDIDWLDIYLVIIDIVVRSGDSQTKGLYLKLGFPYFTGLAVGGTGRGNSKKF